MNWLKTFFIFFIVFSFLSCNKSSEFENDDEKLDNISSDILGDMNEQDNDVYQDENSNNNDYGANNDLYNDNLTLNDSDNVEYDFVDDIIDDINIIDTDTVNYKMEIGKIEEIETEKLLPKNINLTQVTTVANSITLKSDEFAVFYYRKDEDYSKWSLWLWIQGKIDGAEYKFVTIKDGVAYYVGKKDKFFNAEDRIISAIIKTDTWEKDNESDRFFSIDRGNKFLILMEDTKVYPIGKYKPHISKASLYKDQAGKNFLRVKLSGRVGLTIEKNPNNFSISGGLNVVDAFAYENRRDPGNRFNNYSDDILIEYQGEPIKDITYKITHLTYNNSLNIDFPVIDEITKELPVEVIDKLPLPVMDNHPQWINLYYATWKYMYGKITKGNTANRFVPSYIDEGFNENIYQWDSSFMAAYAIYGPDVFPAMPTLDNFYNHQAEDGYICRTYNETTGNATDLNAINPPLFAWMEYRYYKLSGDSGRLSRVLPVLDKYFTWLKNKLHTTKNSVKSDYLYFYNKTDKPADWASGMDDSPRGEYIKEGAWIDLSSQQALAAFYISKLADVISDTALKNKYKNEYNSIKNKINEFLWNSEHNTYYDKKEDGAWHVRNTIASFWPMIAEIPDSEKAAYLIDDHLKNESEFYTPHLFPTLARNDEKYSRTGHYWQGGVWAPTNFMTIKGVAKYNYQFALEASINHIENMSKVYHDFNPHFYTYKMPGLDESNLPRNGQGYYQIWETYSPEDYAPSTRWDNNLLVRQKFCGWSGLGPVALLIENILGFEFNGAENRVVWKINFTERHGIKNLKFGNNKVTLIANERENKTNSFKIMGSAEKDFELIIYNYDSATPAYNGIVKAGNDLNIAITP